jgi:hypothetical protein
MTRTFASLQMGAMVHNTVHNRSELQRLSEELSKAWSKNLELQSELRSARARTNDADLNMREMEEEMIRQVRFTTSSLPVDYTMGQRF